MKNPFVTNGYAGPEYFCDRVEETQHITEMLTNENNMALISPRRIGKTELIRHCFAQPAIQKDYYTFIIDIYWRKRSIPTHSEWLYPLTFDAGNGLKEA